MTNNKFANNKFPYEDIVNLPPHISKKHPQATTEDRAARFSPFAAITGYADMIIETARTTDRRIELDDNEKYILDCNLTRIRNSLFENPLIHVTHFIPDNQKSGGTYIHSSGYIKRIDEYEQLIILTTGEKIKIQDIIGIEF